MTRRVACAPVGTAYLNTLLEATSDLTGPSPESWYDRLEHEESELEASLEDACRTDPALGLRAARLLQRFWFARGRLARGRGWVERLLVAYGERPTAERVEGLIAAAGLAFRMGDTSATRRQASLAVELARQLRIDGPRVDALLALARVGLREGDVHAVTTFAEEARMLALERRDEARELSAIHHLAEGARMAGDLRRARALYEESLTRNRALRNRGVVAVELVNLATVERTEGNLTQAEADLGEAMAISREIRNSYILAACLIVLASVELMAGRLRDAARSLGRADAIYSSTGLVIDPADRADYDRTVAGVRSGLGQEAYAAAHADGEKSALDEQTPSRA